MLWGEADGEPARGDARPTVGHPDEGDDAMALGSFLIPPDLSARDNRLDLLMKLNFAFGFVSQFSPFGGNIQGQRRRHRLAPPPALQTFELVHGLMQLAQ